MTRKFDIGIADWQGWKDASEGEPMMDRKTFLKYFGFPLDTADSQLIEGGDSLGFAYLAYTAAYREEDA